MRKIIFAALAIVSWFGREWLKEVFWERVLHVLNPENNWLLQFGPPVTFAAITIYLSVQNSKRPKKEMAAIVLML